MRQLGQTSVVIWLTPPEAEDLDKVRGHVRRATWARAMVLHAAKQVLQTLNAH